MPSGLGDLRPSRRGPRSGSSAIADIQRTHRAPSSRAASPCESREQVGRAGPGISMMLGVMPGATQDAIILDDGAGALPAMDRAVAPTYDSVMKSVP